MAGLTALILAAGMGVRMGPRGTLTPKGLIQVGGTEMVAQSVAALQAHGVGRIVIVTGHLAEMYRESFGGMPGVELVHNPHYATTGSLRSLVTGLDHVEGPLAILESDLIYEPRVLDPIDGTRNLFMVSGPTGTGDEVYVWTQGEAADGLPRLDEMSKSRTARKEPHLGEMVGITALMPEALPILRRKAAAILARAPEEHYEPGIVALSHEMPVGCLLFPDLAWTEIDTEAMLAGAEARVWPRIVAARAARDA